MKLERIVLAATKWLKRDIAIITEAIYREYAKYMVLGRYSELRALENTTGVPIPEEIAQEGYRNCVRTGLVGNIATKRNYRK